jgi:hypothetical protein
MARSPSLKKKVTKATGNIVNSKYMGDEPLSKGDAPDDIMYLKTLNWYNTMCTKVEAREYLETYFKANGRVAEIKTLRSVPDSRVPDQAAWVARMLTRGVKLKDRSVNKMNELLEQSYHYAEAPKVARAAVVISVQDRIREKVSDFLADFELQLQEQGIVISMYELLQSKQLPPSLANHVAAFFRPIAAEANEVLKKSCDPQLKEGYRNYTTAELKARAAFYNGVLADCARYASNNKKQRTVRKKKAVAPEKKLKTFKFQPESKEYKVVSISPEKILAAEELVTFNTKYKVLTVFYAPDRGKLSVKGTTITDYDQARSQSYRIGRKTEERVEIALKGGKRAFAKMLGTLTPCKLQERTNEYTILLRV